MTRIETPNAARSSYLLRRGWRSIGGEAREPSLGEEMGARFLMLVAAACAGIAGIGIITSAAPSGDSASEALPPEWRWSPDGVEIEQMYSTPMTRGVAQGVHASMYPSQP